MKTCGLCKKAIDEDTEKYVHVEDYVEGKMVRELWCHRACFNQATNQNKKEAARQANVAIEKAKEIFRNLLQSGPGLVYDI